MDAKEQLLYCYEKANEKERILLCILVIIIHEGTKEEKVLLQDFANGRGDVDSIDQIYEKYYPIVQERLAQGFLI